MTQRPTIRPHSPSRLSTAPTLALERIQCALECTASSSSSNNVTVAYRAVSLWDEALQDAESLLLLPTNILSMALQLQASCLVRTGQDERAIQSLEQALKSFSIEDRMQAEDSRIRQLYREKGQSLQRLLMYQPAAVAYVKARAHVEAATCYLRMGDSKSARKILLETSTSDMALLDKAEGQIMLDILCYLSGQPARISTRSLRERIRNASSTFVSPVYKWFYSSMVVRDQDSDNDIVTSFQQLPFSSFVDYCRANVGAWDDPLLVRLDDKIWLHQLLTTSSTTNAKDMARMWPSGLVLSKDAYFALLDNDGTTSNDGIPWIAKRRAGYGSHGNTLIRASLRRVREVLDIEQASADAENEWILLQQMVEPPLLLERRKFSLRVYVVYFMADSSRSRPIEVFVSREGLVKIAALPYEGAMDDENDNPRQHMTNSGREASMRQEPFEFLRSNTPSGKFGDIIWPSIRLAIRTVMDSYEQHAQKQSIDTSEMITYRKMLSKLGLPKILGFDFVLDSSLRAWLVEVNRFPGLEPRDVLADAAIKHQIVRDAWSMMADRNADVNSSWLPNDFQHLHSFRNESILEKL